MKEKIECVYQVSTWKKGSHMWKWIGDSYQHNIKENTYRCIRCGQKKTIKEEK